MEENYGYIYKITDLVNDKIYIGARAKKEFDANYYGSGVKIKTAVSLFGKDNFKIKLIEWCKTKEELIEKEIYWIKKYNSFDKDIGYNVRVGGISGRAIANLSKEQKQKYYRKQSKAQSNRTWIYRGDKLKRVKDKELEEYLQNGWTKGTNSNRKAINKDGKTKYVEFKNLQHYLDEGWKLGQDEKLISSWTQAFRGKHHSEETRKKIGASNRSRQLGEGNSNYGKKWMYNEDLKISKSVNKENINILLKEGWQLGRKIKFD